MRFLVAVPVLLMACVHAEPTASADSAPDAGPGVFGSLDKEQIRQVIHMNREPVRLCYETALSRTPRVHGTVDVEFVISEAGSVSHSRVASSDVHDEALEACVADAVRGWHFPRPKGNGIVIVTYPFLFTSESVDGGAKPSRGGLPRDAIARVINSHQDEIRSCYELELSRHLGLTGKITAVLLIAADGSIGDARITETSLNNPNVESCVLARIQRWTFPEPIGGGIVTVTYPWIFKPARDDAGLEALSP